MLRFCVALIPALALAAHATPSGTTSTTPSPESQLLNLAASADQTLGQKPIDTRFSCALRPLGYYADVNNDCKLYHVCNPSLLPDGQNVVIQYSFFCPGGQVFDQKANLCVPESETPCHESEKYYNVATTTAVVNPTRTVATATAVVNPTRTVAAVAAQAVQVPAVATAPVQAAVAPVANVDVVSVPVAAVAQPATSQVVTKPALTFQPAQTTQRLVQVPTPVQPAQRLVPVQQPGGLVLQTFQPFFIRHFPEPNFHPLTEQTNGKVLRLG